MPGLTLWRHRRSVPGRGISSIAEVPRDPSSKVLHLCRYPDKCCTICDRHRERCWHRVGRRSW
ncbi:MAG TPA: hypothetical protein VIJ00_03280 [Nakamurella sp.]